MKSRSVINYEPREDCFKKCQHVKSRLVYGNPEYIREPWITVLVPTYKRVNMLEEALNSILTQLYTDFFWDIIVVDNEPDDGVENDTERLIRKIDNKRILYYRNSENIRPGDNFNRGFLLARGEWVMMLHDDDFLVSNALKTMGDLISAYDTERIPLGAIAPSYIQVTYDAAHDEIHADMSAINKELCSQPANYRLYKFTHSNLKVLSHIGGTAPTAGCTFRRRAVMEAGGFNEDYGISGDLILFYFIEETYRVYKTTVPLGFYRWGSNGNVKKESAFQVVQCNFDFREYVYQKNWRNRLVGKLFRNCHYRNFVSSVIHERKEVSNRCWTISDFDSIYCGRPNPIWYLCYKGIVKAYMVYKLMQGKMAAKRAARIMEAADS